ncbi:hypothetical protein BCR42DRAFT_419409 [Absidia repens]|uniref:Uncharacterized protein n=1 Tax=Absidia repens TaxID=90262 RepID=A0A1X2IB99_9FUNG|nr:hypothetical protein BCR42DRAFT_419409 [Absidia repens]
MFLFFYFYIYALSLLVLLRSDTLALTIVLSAFSKCHFYDACMRDSHSAYMNF